MAEHNHLDNKIHEKFELSLKLGILLNSVYIIIEFIFGLVYNSMALVADAGHNFSDVISLILAWIALWMIKKKSSSKYTYGFKKGSILIALANAFLLIFALGVITYEAIKRLYSFSEVNGFMVILTASIGIVINGITAILFIKGKNEDLNIKAAFMHMLTDTLVSIGVVISGILLIYFNVNWIDPVVSLIIVIIIFIGTWKLLKDTIKLSIDAVPSQINFDEVFEYLKNITGVTSIHDLHIWALSTSQIAMTVHLVVQECIDDEELINMVNFELNNKFKISHSTIQIEKEKKYCKEQNC